MKARLLAGWKNVTEGVAAAAFALMFAAFTIQIFSRYVLNMPVAWSLELCTISNVWVVFW
jgi:TRAP-type C4-dicarboxylate transport system permease small subunit